MSGYIGTTPQKMKRGWIGVPSSETVMDYIETSDTEFSVNPVKDYYELVDGEYVKTSDFTQNQSTGAWEGSMASHPGKTYYELHPYSRVNTVNKKIKKAWVGDSNGIPQVALNTTEFLYETIISKNSNIPYNVYGGQIVFYNDDVHFLGGSISGNETKHYSYDGTSWTQESPLPYDFKYGSAVVYDNKIHILGGVDNETNHYSWDGTSWTQESTLPYDFYRGSAVVMCGKIFILGSAADSASAMYSWDGTSWTQEYSSSPFSFAFSNAAVSGPINGFYYIICINNYCYKYDNSTGTGGIYLCENDEIPHIYATPSIVPVQNIDNYYRVITNLHSPDHSLIIHKMEIRKTGYLDESTSNAKFTLPINSVGRSKVFDNATRAVYIDDQLYIFEDDRICYYDEAYSTFMNINEQFILPYMSKNSSMLNINDEVHLLGGSSSDYVKDIFNIYAILDDNWVEDYFKTPCSRMYYVLKNNRWIRKDNLPFSVEEDSCNVLYFNNSIHYLKPYSDKSAMSHYELVNGIWTSHRSLTPTSSSYYYYVYGAGVLNGKLYAVVRSRNKTGTVSNNLNIYIYDENSDTWSYVMRTASFGSISDLDVSVYSCTSGFESSTYGIFIIYKYKALSGTPTYNWLEIQRLTIENGSLTYSTFYSEKYNNNSYTIDDLMIYKSSMCDIDGLLYFIKKVGSYAYFIWRDIGTRTRINGSITLSLPGHYQNLYNMETDGSSKALIHDDFLCYFGGSDITEHHSRGVVKYNIYGVFN